MHRTLKIAVTAIATGALAGSAALASALITPPTPDTPTDLASPVATGSPVVDGADAPAPNGADGLQDLLGDSDVGSQIASMLDGADLPDGQLYVGAAKRNLYPTPDETEGEYWERDPAKCNQLSENFFTNIADQPDHLMTAGSTWPENPNCIYQGGFGIGPTNGVSDFDGGVPNEDGSYDDPDALGIWVRALSLSDGEDTLVLSIVDGEGYLWDYANKCERCGAKQIGEDVAASLTEQGYPVSKDGIVLAATHTHAGPEFLGAWGFVPDWYMEDVTALIHETLEEAVTSAVPAIVEIGEEEARRWNSERRDTYRSAEEQQLGWLRATAAVGRPAEQGAPAIKAGDTIVTLGVYAAHPTRFDTNDNVAHPDWPGLFTKAAEDRFGGIGVLMMTGLGNMSGSGPTEQMGDGLVSLIPPVGEGERLDGTDIRLKQTLWKQPVTNAPLTALGLPGFADRQFLTEPSAVEVGKADDRPIDAENGEFDDDGYSPCVSASPYSVELPALAAWIGSDFAITTGPGELFANGTNTIKDESGARIAFPLAQANDALGYMPQSFEFQHKNQQGAGFAIGGFAGVNYEDSYAIDACTGDMWLETTLDALAEIR